LVRVAGGGLAGLRLWLNLRREKYLWLGTYEPWVQEAMAHYLRPGDWAWDIGAFIGYHMLFMWRLGANVVALEPDPDNFARLTKNLEANGAYSVKALRLAAGEMQGRARLRRVNGHPSITSSVESSNYGECSVVTLDSRAVDLPPPRLVKIDVEGAELEVLRGAVRVLREARPVWIIEVHGSVDHVTGYQVRRIGKGVGFDLHLPVGGPSHLLALPLGVGRGPSASTQ
jgi:FkbM family methyltransferase